MGTHLERLVAIMDRLREPGGCPWDRAMTPEKLRPYLIEETYEVLEAIDAGDDAALREELGDLLLQIVFHARLAKERGAFELEDVAEAVCEKLVARHPHVFGERKVRGVEEVLANWEEMKRKERREKGGDDGLLSGLPKSLPALLFVYRIAEKRERTGEAVPNEDALRRRLTAALSEDDFGGALLALALLCFRRGVEPENALREAARELVEETRAEETR